MTFMHPNDQDDTISHAMRMLAATPGLDPTFAAAIAPRRAPSAMSERDIRELEARAEVALSELRAGRRTGGTEIDHRGYAAYFRTRATALCARALLSDELLDHVSMQMRNGRWVVAGAWRRDLLAGAR